MWKEIEKKTTNKTLYFYKKNPKQFFSIYTI